MHSRLVTALLVLSLGLAYRVQGEEPQTEKKIQRANVAGQFYPVAANELDAAVSGYYSNPKKITLPGVVRGLIVPHAGYAFSGQVAASGYQTLPDNLKRFVIIAANHTPGIPPFKFAVSDADVFETPLGKVRVSPAAKDLLKDPLFRTVPLAFSSHIIEVQLPFLQKKYNDFEIVPVVAGDIGSSDLKKVIEAIKPIINSETALIVSSDLSHYHSYEQAKSLDAGCISALASVNPQQAADCEACGLPGALILLQLAVEKGWHGKIIDYKNSGDVPLVGDKSRVVGYSAIAFYQEELNPEERKKLLTLARKSLEEAAGGGDFQALIKSCQADLPPSLNESKGCFVTLTINKELRGCIGDLGARLPLYRCVIENAANASQRDPRFPPVSADQVGKISIEISVLTKPARVPAEVRAKLLDFLVPRKHGVVLANGLKRSTFLPQVWEQVPDKQDFLAALCRKGGMDLNCWQDPATQVETYEDMAIKESEL